MPSKGDDSKACCKFCNTDKQAHLKDLKDHAETKKHKMWCQPTVKAFTFHHWLVTADCTDRNLNQEDALTLHFSVAASSEHCYAVQLLSEMYKDQQPLIAFSPSFTVGNKSCQQVLSVRTTTLGIRPKILQYTPLT